VRLTRDPFGRLIRISDSVGRWIELIWEGERIVKARDFTARSVQYIYTPEGRLSERVDPDGGVTRYTYDGAGRLSTIADARGIVYLTNEYDEKGRVIRQLGPNGEEIVRMTYRQAGQVTVEGEARYPGGGFAVSSLMGKDG
jgi:YD repeat-containing protein